MKKQQIAISGNMNSYKIVTLNDSDQLEDVIFGGENFKSIKSNIYLGQITKVEPSLQAAFVSYGENKSGFLPFSEIHPSYYKNEKTLKDVLVSFCNPEKKHEISAVANEAEVENTLSDDVDDLEKVEFDLAEDAEEGSNVNQQESKSTHDKKSTIQDVMKTGQFVLVQVFKDERGNKGASLTTYITMPTKYFVFTPNNKRLSGVSRRITNGAEKNRLKKFLLSINISEESGLVVRTAASGVDDIELLADYESVAMKKWKEIIDKASENTIGLIAKSESRLISSIRDITNLDTKIFVDNEEISSLISSIAGDLISVKKDSIVLHKDKKQSLFDKLYISEKLKDLYKDRVNLPSGGYIIINYTEALVAIDVNSGSLVRENSIENTALKTNLEAAKAVADHLRLRDIGGLIVVDFIDMDDLSNRKKVEMKMKDEICAKDKARVQFTTISPFGLMEVSRQRLRTGFIDVSTNKCSHCYGTGRIFKAEIVLDELYKTLENIFATSNFESKFVKAECSTEAESMFNYYNKSEILKICKAANVEFEIVKIETNKKDKFVVFGSQDGVSFLEIAKFNGLSDIGEARSFVDIYGEPKEKINSASVELKSKFCLFGFIKSLFSSKKSSTNVQKKSLYQNKNRGKNFEKGDFAGKKKHYNSDRSDSGNRVSGVDGEGKTGQRSNNRYGSSRSGNSNRSRSRK
jgi:ribonuclease E